MIFIAEIRSKIKPSGKGCCFCPACSEHVTLNTCKKYSVVALFFIPVLPFGSEYIATCSSCASVFSLTRSQGKVLEKNPEIEINPGDLQLIQNNVAHSCGHCGAKGSPDHNFCPNCGQHLS